MKCSASSSTCSHSVEDSRNICIAWSARHLLSMRSLEMSVSSKSQTTCSGEMVLCSAAQPTYATLPPANRDAALRNIFCVLLCSVCRVDAASTMRKVVAAAEIRVANYGWLHCSATQCSSEIGLFFEIRWVQQLRISAAARGRASMPSRGARHHRAGGLELVASVRYMRTASRREPGSGNLELARAQDASSTFGCSQSSIKRSAPCFFKRADQSSKHRRSASATHQCSAHTTAARNATKIRARDSQIGPVCSSSSKTPSPRQP